jgi:hypothetical protein
MFLIFQKLKGIQLHRGLPIIIIDVIYLQMVKRIRLHQIMLKIIIVSFNVYWVKTYSKEKLILNLKLKFTPEKDVSG